MPDNEKQNSNKMRHKITSSSVMAKSWPVQTRDPTPNGILAWGVLQASTIP